MTNPKSKGLIATVALTLGLIAPATANAQVATEEACMVINRVTNAQAILIGPGAGTICGQLIAVSPGTYYSTQRPPDTILCGARKVYGAYQYELIYGAAFGAHAGVDCVRGGATWGSNPASVGGAL